jgi:DMSO/TMAO reductase YedYZ molybdopterin-dependent catalytic subunit
MNAAPATTETDDRLVRRTEEPLNLEMTFASLREFVTPNEKFYVRCHFPVPQIDAASWKLRIEGAVKNAIALTLDELKQLPQHTIPATMECAGNGRSHLEPKVKGVAWDIGAVGNANWTGVWLRDVLERAGLSSDAQEVVLEGADRGAIKEPPRPPGEIHYARGVPIAKANADVLLAFEMNGALLTPEHGFPLRAVVPGWFGMASVKWLQRIVVTREPFNGYYQSIDYTYWEERDGMPTLVPLAEMRVKAQIARPHMGEVLAAGEKYRVFGAAWAGEDEVVKVEFSDDEGASWQTATLLGDAQKNAWRFWEFQWSAPAGAGDCVLMARATDSAGRTQPRQRIQEYGTYMINHVLPIRVQVR